jgi:hypothetical protein
VIAPSTRQQRRGSSAPTEDQLQEEPAMDPEQRRLFIFQTALALAGAAALVAAMAVKGWAHQAPTGWAYPFECCAGIDCAEIPANAVKETPDGYRVTLSPGEHPMVKAPFAAVVPYASARSAPDGAYHICLSAQLKVLCFFAGSRGV